MIAIFDFGSQYSKIIARKIRESHVYCEVLPHNTALHVLKEKKVKGIICSGGPSSVFHENSPKANLDLYEANIPILGICYGMQMMAMQLEGEVIPGDKHEYGKAILNIDQPMNLFHGFLQEIPIWMSHGDMVIKMPKGFQRLGHTSNCAIASMGNYEKKLYGVQFHPEVTHTPKGLEIRHLTKIHLTIKKYYKILFIPFVIASQTGHLSLISKKFSPLLKRKLKVKKYCVLYLGV